jgi:adenylylsulfate kinase-like enzyme|tara:strand:+ start:497 stop:1024 length:528 start_codon:yes stop_codon:yes gene_type:complete
MKKKINKKGILFWITGLSGSGKTSLAKKIFPFVEKSYGATVHLDGDSLRNILNLHGYSFKERASNAVKFTKISKFLTDQGINVVFSIVGLMNKPRSWNRKNIKRYIEIFIKSDVKKIISVNKKKIYRNKKNIVGVNIKPQFPKNPHITIDNTFDKDLNVLELELRLKIRKIMINK